MPFDLLNYIQLEDHPQPDELTAAFKSLFMALRQAPDAQAWAPAIDTYMAQAQSLIGQGLLHGWNAAGAMFVGQSLAAGLRANGREGGLRILGFVIQLSMSEAQWAAAQQVMKADRANAQDSAVLRVADFPRTVLEYLFKHSDRDILREIYTGARFAIDDAAQSAMKDATSFEDWQARLGVLAAYLTLRRWLPLKVKAEGASEDHGGRIELQAGADGQVEGGRFVAPPQEDHPILAWLFSAEEIENLHRREAYAAECFAHLFASHFGGMITPEHQKEVAEDYARRAADNRLDARQWLALGKSRFEIAPYL